MQCDELIWKTIAFNFCSFKLKTPTQNFCRNENNLTNLCSRQSCPLANSKYATVRCISSSLYLYTKTIERAHAPSKMYTKTKLSKNYQTALKQIDEHLLYYPDFIIHKSKQRLTKLVRSLIKQRKLILKPKPQVASIHKKVERREVRRELKAEVAARLDQTIEKELLSRFLKKSKLASTLTTTDSQLEIETEDQSNLNLNFDDDDELDLDDDDEDYYSLDDDNDESSDSLDESNNNSIDSSNSDDSFESDSESDTSITSTNLDIDAAIMTAGKISKNKSKKRGGRMRVGYEVENEVEMSGTSQNVSSQRDLQDW